MTRSGDPRRLVVTVDHLEGHDGDSECYELSFGTDYMDEESLPAPLRAWGQPDSRWRSLRMGQARVLGHVLALLVELQYNGFRLRWPGRPSEQVRRALTSAREAGEPAALLRDAELYSVGLRPDEDWEWLGAWDNGGMWVGAYVPPAAGITKRKLHRLGGDLLGDVLAQ